MTPTQIAVTIAGALAIIWVLWYFLAPPPPAVRAVHSGAGTPPAPLSVPES